jgi:hypothetical protein
MLGCTLIFGLQAQTPVIELKLTSALNHLGFESEIHTCGTARLCSVTETSNADG